MNLHFEWDDLKAAVNLEKHGISFDEAQTIFSDPRSVTIFDDQHSDNEDRYIDIGISTSGRVLVVVHTETEGRIRIISCRRATQKERKQYE